MIDVYDYNYDYNYDYDYNLMKCVKLNSTILI